MHIRNHITAFQAQNGSSRTHAPKTALIKTSADIMQNQLKFF